MRIKKFFKTLSKTTFAVFLFTAFLMSSPNSFASNPVAGVEKKVEGVLKKLLMDSKFLKGLLNPALKAAKLPDFDDLQTTAKCMRPTAKDLKKLLMLTKKNPLDPEISTLLEEMKGGKCRKELSSLADDCQGPGVLAASMTPAGGAIAAICGQVTAIDGEVDAAIAHAENAQRQAKLAKKALNSAKKGDLAGAASDIKKASEDSDDSDDDDDDDDSKEDDDDDSSNDSDDDGDDT